MKKIKVARAVSLALILIPIFSLAATHKEHIDVPTDLKDAPNDPPLGTAESDRLTERARQQSRDAALAPRPQAQASQAPLNGQRSRFTLVDEGGKTKWFFEAAMIDARGLSMIPSALIFDESDGGAPKGPFKLASHPADMRHCAQNAVVRLLRAPADGSGIPSQRGVLFLKCLSGGPGLLKEGRAVAWWGFPDGTDLTGGSPEEEYNRIMTLYPLGNVTP